MTEKKRRWYFDFRQDWTEWFSGGYNWKEFTLIHVYYEDEVCMGTRELLLALLGLTLRITYLYDDKTGMRTKIQQRLDDWMEENGLSPSPPPPSAEPKG